MKNASKLAVFCWEVCIFLVLFFALWWFFISAEIIEPVEEITINEKSFRMPFVFSRWLDFIALSFFWLIPLSALVFFQKLEDEVALRDFGIVMGIMMAILSFSLFFLVENPFIFIAFFALIFPFLFAFLTRFLYGEMGLSWNMNLRFSVTFLIVPGFCWGFPFMILFFVGSWVVFLAGICLDLLIRGVKALRLIIQYGKDWRNYSSLMV